MMYVIVFVSIFVGVVLIFVVVKIVDLIIKKNIASDPHAHTVEETTPLESSSAKREDGDMSAETIKNIVTR